MSLGCFLPVKILRPYCLAWKFTGCDMQTQKISVCVLSVVLLLEEAGGGTRDPEATWCASYGSFRLVWQRCTHRGWDYQGGV